MDFGSLVKDLGFPIALAVYFIIKDGKSQKERLEDVKTFGAAATKALDKSTEALENNSKILAVVNAREQRNGGN